jgi:hypothetical protein
MKRSELVDKLIKEGMSSKTLVRFTDKQLLELSERLLGEANQKGNVVMPKGTSNPADVKKLTDQGLNVELREKKKEVGEELKGGQKKLDKNHNGKIDGQDFKILKGQKKEVKEVKVEKKCEKCDCVESKCKCKKSENWKNVKKESIETKKWVNKLAEEKFHSFTSKNEIMELIQSKLTESEVMEPQHGSNVKRGHNGVPEFMSYDMIANDGDTKTAPAKPTTKPGTKPGTTPSKPKTPYQPGPGPKHKPKAFAEEKK